MSTRCNVVIDDGNEQLYFYRHSDGYPECTAESLKRFLRWLLAGKIRGNAGQASGWLILLGAAEYQTVPPNLFIDHKGAPRWDRDNTLADAALERFEPEYWKCGAYEPTTGIHGDIQYLYVIDLTKKQISCHKPPPNADYTRLPKPFAIIDKDNLEIDCKTLR